MPCIHLVYTLPLEYLQTDPIPSSPKPSNPFPRNLINLNPIDATPYRSVKALAPAETKGSADPVLSVRFASGRAGSGLVSVSQRLHYPLIKEYTLKL